MRKLVSVTGEITWIQEHRGLLPPFNKYLRFGVRWNLDKQKSFDGDSKILGFHSSMPAGLGTDPGHFSIKSDMLQLGDVLHIGFSINGARVKNESEGWNPNYKINRIKKDMYTSVGFVGDWYIFHTNRSHNIKIGDVVTAVLWKREA